MVSSVEEHLVVDLAGARNASFVIFTDWPTFNSSNTVVATELGVATEFSPPGSADSWLMRRAGDQLTPDDRSVVNAAMEAMANKHAFSHHVPLYAHFCGGGDGVPQRCSRELPGTNVNSYYDEDHINYAGSIYLWHVRRD